MAAATQLGLFPWAAWVWHSPYLTGWTVGSLQVESLLVYLDTDGRLFSLHGWSRSCSFWSFPRMSFIVQEDDTRQAWYSLPGRGFIKEIMVPVSTCELRNCLSR